MRNFLIAAAVSLTALTAAAPASAQYYPAPQPYPYYAQSYGYGGGHYQLARAYGQHVDRLRTRIERLDRRDRISDREARSLRREAVYLRDYVIRARNNGFNWRERREIETRLARLEQRIQHERRDGNDRRYGAYYAGGGDWIDRDHDGRDDRWERRRERERDRDRDRWYDDDD